jgi:hypothetical protein
MIGVTWSKDSRSDPAATKEQFCPILLDFSVALRRAEMRRGWMPSRMKIRRLPNSLAKFLPVKAHIKEHPA